MPAVYRFTSMDLEIILFLAVSALIVGLGKGGLGSAFVGVLTPIVSIFMPVSEAIAYILPLFLIGDFFALRLYWGRWDAPQLKLMIPPGLVTVLTGTYLLSELPNHTLRVILGIIALVIGVYKLLESNLARMQYHYHVAHPPIAGAVAGMGSGLANAGGPLLTAYLLLIRMKPVPYIATTALFFALMNLVRIPALILTDVLKMEKLLMVIWFLPLVWLGNHVGHRLIDWINPRQFERLMVGILIVAGLILIFR